ncbi:MAG: tyrosine-type recombinase/integrase [Thermomicrobiales bacterium]
MDNKAVSPTLAEALTLYKVEHLAGRNLAPLTRAAYTRDLEALITWVEQHAAAGIPTAIDKIERRHLERYLAHMDSLGLAGSYRRRKVAAIRSFFGFLHEQGFIPRSPAEKLIPPARARYQPRVLTEAEYKRLLDAVRHEVRDGAIIEVLLQTGLRLSELSQLRIGDVELPPTIRRPNAAAKDPGSVGAVHAHGKGRKERTVTLNWKACKAIKAYLAVRPDDAENDRLFVTKFRRGMGPRAIQRVIEKYVKEAGIPNASVHALRHTFATHQTRRGTKLDVVRQALGHESLATTSIYVDLARDVMDKELQEHAL